MAPNSPAVLGPVEPTVMQRHAPTHGPWSLKRGPTYWGLYHPDTSRLLATVAHNKRSNSDANAELLVAAPEMLAALRELHGALRELHGALRERHHGRMPEDVQQAYDKAGALLGRFGAA